MNIQVGRNDPCPCGSKKKYKQCCFGKAEKSKQEQLVQEQPQKVRPSPTQQSPQEAPKSSLKKLNVKVLGANAPQTTPEETKYVFPDLIARAYNIDLSNETDEKK